MSIDPALFDYQVFFHIVTCNRKCKQQSSGYGSTKTTSIIRCQECKNSDHWVARLTYKDRILFEIYPATYDSLDEMITEEFNRLYKEKVLG